MSTPGHQPPPSPQLQPSSRNAGTSTPPQMFAAPPPEPSGRGKLIAVVAAVAVVLLMAAVLFFRGGRPANPVSPNAIRQPDAYAKNLVFTQLAMSESTSLSGGKSTFIDGHVKNSGPDTVTGVTMQVLFRNDLNMPPQVETLPLTLIRTHDPYVDTEPVSAAPLKPGDEAEFRLIFETVTGSWNQQMPDLAAVGVTKR